MNADGKNENRESGKWSSTKTIFWKSTTDTSSQKTPEGEGRKQIHPICGEIYPYSWRAKRCLTVCNHVRRTCDMSPRQLWHFSHHQQGLRMERGQCSSGRCYSFLLECRDLHNYTTTSVNGCLAICSEEERSDFIFEMPTSPLWVICIVWHLCNPHFFFVCHLWMAVRDFIFVFWIFSPMLGPAQSLMERNKR